MAFIYIPPSCGGKGSNNLPYIISEETILIIPASDVQTLINDAIIDIPFSGTFDTSKTYYAEYDNKEYKTTNVDKDELYFSSDGFYLEFDVGYNKNWGKDATKTRCAMYDPNTITNATDIVIKTKEVKYLNNRYINPNITGLESLSSVNSTGVTGQYSIAMGEHSQATSDYSFAVGKSTNASGESSHAEGKHSIASGSSSHAEGEWAKALGEGSHAEGCYTIASGDYQHVQGKNNVADTENKYAHIVGNGTNTVKKSNAHTLDWDGNGWYKGEVYVGGTSQDDGKKLATEEFVNTAISNVDLSAYAKKTELPTVPTKVSELTNDKNYLTSVPSEYVTETELNNKKYLTQHQNISHLASKTDISNMFSFDSDGYLVVTINGVTKKFVPADDYDDAQV